MNPNHLLLPNGFNIHNKIIDIQAYLHFC